MDPVKAARREQRVERRRGAILKAAKSAFIAKPYSEVTVEGIAETAGLSKAAVYLYFRTKAEIYERVLLTDLQILVDAMRATYDKTRSVQDNLLLLGEEYVRYFRENSEYYKTLSFFYYPGRGTKLPPDVGLRVEEIFASAMAVVEECIRDAIERGEIGSRDSGETAATLWSMWLGATYLSITDPNWRYSGSLDQIVRTGVMTFVHGLGGQAR